MRLGWAVLLGAAGAAAAAWWLADRPDRAVPADRGAAASGSPSGDPAGGRPLYRWRDDAGTLQLTQQPPDGRPFERVDVHALEQRNLVPSDAGDATTTGGAPDPQGPATH